MCMNVKQYQSEIKQYCINNNLSYDKTMSAIKGCGNDTIIFQVSEQRLNKKGMLDETPLPTVLIMRKNNNQVEFEQTEYTQKYLSI